MGFDQLPGNQKAKDLIRGYLLRDTIPGSLIFYGPTSSRATEFALAFSKALSCLKSEKDFCGRCEHCREIQKGIFPDVTILVPAGQFYKKEQITGLIRDNIQRPVKSDRKIYLLHQAHRMQAAAANAFLKVLEEPAESTVIILVTPLLEGLLPTIRSRCQVIRFSGLSCEELRLHLKTQGLSDPDARLLANYSVSEQIDVFTCDIKELRRSREVALKTLTSLLQEKEAEKVLIDLFQMGKNRKNFSSKMGELVNLISLLLRDIMVTKITDGSERLINFDLRPPLEGLSRGVETYQVMELVWKMDEFLRDSELNLNARTLIHEFFRAFPGRRAGAIP